MNDRKILHINCNYIDTNLHQNMIESLEELGVENDIFVPIFEGKIGRIKINSNVKVSECFKKWNRILFDYKQKKIFNVIQNSYVISKFDLIHAYTLFTDGNCARKLYKKYNIPYVVAIRNTDVNTFFKYMIHLRKRGIQIMQDASAIFFLSEPYKDEVFKKYVPKELRKKLLEKSFVIPNGIENFWFKNPPLNLEKNIKGKKIRLIYAGVIDKNKNIIGTQRAINELKKEGWDIELTVVGRTKNKKIYNLLSDDRNITCIIQQPKENLLELYRKHDIFIMPSFTETFGLVYGEAMSQGLPVIYSRGQGFDKQFTDGEVGYPVNAKSIDDIKFGIKNIIKNYVSIQKKVVLKSKKFYWSQICKKYISIYETIIEKGNKND